MEKIKAIVKHPVTWAFLGVMTGTFCQKCTPWVQTIGNIVTNVS